LATAGADSTEATWVSLVTAASCDFAIAAMLVSVAVLKAAARGSSTIVLLLIPALEPGLFDEKENAPRCAL
jgi:hypothetical protein